MKISNALKSRHLNNMLRVSRIRCAVSERVHWWKKTKKNKNKKKQKMNIPCAQILPSFSYLTSCPTSPLPDLFLKAAFSELHSSISSSLKSLRQITSQWKALSSCSWGSLRMSCGSNKSVDARATVSRIAQDWAEKTRQRTTNHSLDLQRMVIDCRSPWSWGTNCSTGCLTMRFGANQIREESRALNSESNCARLASKAPGNNSLPSTSQICKRLLHEGKIFLFSECVQLRNSRHSLY